MDNFEDFNNMFNEDGSFDYDSLGQPDESHEFEKNGTIYLERIWYRDNGSELRHTLIMNNDGDFSDGEGLSTNDFKITAMEDISPEDMEEFFKFRNTLPLNFLDMLSIGAENYSNIFDRKPIMAEREKTLEEKIADIIDAKEIAVNKQNYEEAANLRDRQDKLLREIEERDSNK